VKLGTENRKEIILAGALVAVLVAVLIYQFMPSSSTSASTTPTIAPAILPAAPVTARPNSRRASSPAAASNKRQAAPQNLDPTLHLDQLARAEQIKYEGSGRNIFVADAEPIPIPQGTGATDRAKKEEQARIYTPPPVSPAPAIPLKFFGFANQPGERKKIFLSKGDDVWVAGEGEVVDRRYKVIRISPNSVEIQDVVGSGPPQMIPLTQG
jgi:hypothetical protein